MSSLLIFVCLILYLFILKLFFHTELQGGGGSGVTDPDGLENTELVKISGIQIEYFFI